MICNPLGIYTVMGLLVQMQFLFLSAWGVATLSFTMVELIYTPTNSVKAFPFLYFLSSIYCLVIFNNCHSNWHEMLSLFGFDLHLSNDQWWWFFISWIDLLIYLYWFSDFSFISLSVSQYFEFFIGYFVDFFKFKILSLIFKSNSKLSIGVFFLTTVCHWTIVVVLWRCDFSLLFLVSSLLPLMSPHLI